VVGLGCVIMWQSETSYAASWLRFSESAWFIFAFVIIFVFYSKKNKFNDI